jgi:type II secretory ATPase GspE/PulE/Tfp pilus assembly ATPase PilB-like protein
LISKPSWVLTNRFPRIIVRGGEASEDHSVGGTPEERPDSAGPDELPEVAGERAAGADDGDPAAGQDRREALRFATGESTATGFSGQRAEVLPAGAQVCDIGAGGLQLVFDRPGDGRFPLAVDDHLGFTLRVEGSRRSFDLLGRVRWVDPGGEGDSVSVGVQFCGMDQETSHALRRTLVNVAFGRDGAPPKRSGARRKRGKPSTRVISKPPSRRRRLFLGEILVRQGALDQERLTSFLENEYSGSRPLGEELAARGLVDKVGVARALAEQHRLGYVDLARDPPDEALCASLPRAIFEKHCALPLRRERGALLVAMSRPPTLPVVEEIRAAVGRRVRVCIAAEESLIRWRGWFCLLRYAGLVDRGAVSYTALEQAWGAAHREGISIESVLISAFRVSKRKLLEVLSKHFACPSYEFDPYAAPPRQLRERVADRYEQLKSSGFAPVAGDSGAVTVAMSDPFDAVTRARAEHIFSDRRVEFAVALPDDVAAAVDCLFGVDTDSSEAMVGQLIQELAEDGRLGPVSRDEYEPDEALISEDDSAIVRLINRIIEDAHSKGASDIHIEPSPQASTVVRYRIDGVLHRAMTFPARYSAAVVSRIKVMSELDIAEHRRAQSGKIRFKRWGRIDVELRVETFPSAGGVEDAVLRILSAARPRALDEIDMSAHNLEELRRLIAKPHGLLLCVGPTGSGKTTTLHSALGHINRDGIKILTAEDPVEITQPGLRQVQINNKAGITFASSLRSFLRADPDVIMIGEMRDHETAATAVEASMTGHLVLSTLHTNSAPETVVRLLELGIDPYCLSDALLGVLAQRLVRTLCPECPVVGPVGEGLLAEMRSDFGNPQDFDTLGFLPESQLARPREGGCAACHGSGYLGRMAVHELLSVSDAVRELIVRKASASELRRVAVDEGMRTLRQDGIRKVLAGRTSIEEVRRACSR